MNNYWYVVLVYYLTSFNIPRYFYIIFNEKDRKNVFISGGIKRPKYKKISKILWEKTLLGGERVYQTGCSPFNSIKELAKIMSSIYLSHWTEEYITYSWFRVKEINIKHEYKNIYKIKRE
jgi:hypothetical protein